MNKAAAAFMAVIFACGVAATVYIMWPYIKGANQKVANAKADTTVATTQMKDNEAVNVAQTKAQNRIITIQVPVQKAAAQIQSAPPGTDPSAAFFAGVCGSGLYDTDAHCAGAH